MAAPPRATPLTLTLSALLLTTAVGEDPKCLECPPDKGCLPTWANHFCVFLPDPGRPYSRNSFLVTHNSFALSSVWMSWTSNQARSIATQLADGVRGFMLDLWLHDGVIKLCHGSCDKKWTHIQYDKQPSTFVSALETFRDFLDIHPDQVLTLFLESYVPLADVGREYDRANLTRFIYPRIRWPASGQEWPTLKEMAPAIVVFTSEDYDYLRESMYGKIEVDECAQREESSLHNNLNRTLLLVNHFESLNSGLPNSLVSLQKKLKTCHDTWGRWANFLAVDYYENNLPESSTIRAVSWLNSPGGPKKLAGSGPEMPAGSSRSVGSAFVLGTAVVLAGCTLHPGCFSHRML